jgi:two-component system sensor histidine kinase UhpB
MQERVEGLMGTMKISSMPGQGTRIEVRFHKTEKFQDAA